MPFDLKHAPETREPVLLHVDDSKDPAVCIFSDDSKLEMPKGLKYVPDNVLPDRMRGADPTKVDARDHADVKVRLLIQRESVKDLRGLTVARPNMWLILHCQKVYVENTIKRLISEG